MTATSDKMREALTGLDDAVQRLVALGCPQDAVAALVTATRHHAAEAIRAGVVERMSPTSPVYRAALLSANRVENLPLVQTEKD